MSRVQTVQSLQGYFFDTVNEVASRQRFDASEYLFSYLVNLLTLHARSEAIADRLPGRGTDYKPLAGILSKTLDADRAETVAELVRVGDAATFIGGYFYESMERRLVDVDYYAGIGRASYKNVSHMIRGQGVRGRTLADTYDELSQKLPQVFDLLHEISSQNRPASARNTLRLYELFQKNHSRWAERMLRDRGIDPVMPAGDSPASALN